MGSNADPLGKRLAAKTNSAANPRKGEIPMDKGEGCSQSEKREELAVFLFLAVLLAPILATLIVGGYGLMVWLYQIVTGPPSA